MSGPYDKKIEDAYKEVVDALFMGNTAAIVGVGDIDLEMSAPVDETQLRHLTISATVKMLDGGLSWKTEAPATKTTPPAMREKKI